MKKAVTKKHPKRRHRGSIRSSQRRRYVEAALAAALLDPDLQPHVALLGTLFGSRRGRKVMVKHLTRALAARHPLTGKQLRKRVNEGFRREGESLVSNVTHGFDVPLSTDKSITVAALVFKDELVLKIAMDAMRQAARWLGKKMDRRLRRGGQNATVATGESAAFFIPEKAGRDGQPQLHSHVIIPNLTSFMEDGKTRFCAGHFRRITRHAMQAQQRMNRQIGRNLQRAGYAVKMEDGVCRLPSVSRSLCDQLSPVSARLRPEGDETRAPRGRPSRASIRKRENRYLKDRPKKLLQPLSQWRRAWERDIGAERLSAEIGAYRESRQRLVDGPKPKTGMVVPFPRVMPTEEPVVAGLRSESAHDDVLDAVVMRPSFRSVGVALRQKLEAELSLEARHQVIELDYTCTDKRPNLVEHIEALRTLLRLIFPRLILHLKFTETERPGFKVTGAAAGNPKIAQLICATASALEGELGQEVVRNNWPAVLRWLHVELDTRPLGPVRTVAKAAVRLQDKPARQQHKASQRPLVAPLLPPAPETRPAPTIEPEWDMMP